MWEYIRRLFDITGQHSRDNLRKIVNSNGLDEDYKNIKKDFKKAIKSLTK